MEWINVNDSIPNDDRYVLAFKKPHDIYDDDNWLFEIGYFDGDKYYFYEQSECRLINNITHWCELKSPI